MAIASGPMKPKLKLTKFKCELCQAKLEMLDIDEHDVLVVTTQERPSESMVKMLSKMSTHLDVKVPIVILNDNITISSLPKDETIRKIEDLITKYQYILESLTE